MEMTPVEELPVGAAAIAVPSVEEKRVEKSAVVKPMLFLQALESGQNPTHRVKRTTTGKRKVAMQKNVASSHTCLNYLQQRRYRKSLALILHQSASCRRRKKMCQRNGSVPRRIERNAMLNCWTGIICPVGLVLMTTMTIGLLHVYLPVSLSLILYQSAMSVKDTHLP